MRKMLCALLPLAFSVLTSDCISQPPATKKIPVTDTYYGKQVADNYRWLEDMNNKDVQDWFKAQHDYTESWLEKISGRDQLFEDFKKLDALKPANINNVVRKANRYFYKKTLPSENVGKLYYRDGQHGKEILLYNPLANAGGKTYSINYFVPSEDGKKVAVGIAEGGAEVATIYIMNADTKKMYPEKIYPSWFGVSSWTPDNKGFIYTIQATGDNKSMDMLTNTRSMYHIVGTDPKNDQELLSLRKYPSLGIVPEDLCFVYYTEDFKYIIGLLAGVNQDMNCFYAPATELLKPTIAWKRLLQKNDHVTSFVADGDNIYMLTYANAPKYKIIKSNLANVSIANAETVIEAGKDKIDGISRSKDYLFITYSDGINSTAKQFNLRNGTTAWVDLPFSGSAFLGAYDIKTNDCLIYLTSWKKPLTLFDYNPASAKTTESVFNIPVKYPGTDDIVVEETEARSHDGVMVPLSIIYNKNVKKNGNATCLLEGYGAYGISYTPFFNEMRLALLNRGVICAFAHVRGGSEKGDDWYKAGYKTTKPNTWKDFIACAEHLVKNNYTSSSKLIGMGTSAGGILIGRAITERPDLFAAAISNVSCSNALRFENTPNGLNNAREFGTIKDSVECMALYEMDAFQHVKEGTKYPAVVCVGGMNDPRVIAWQPGKFAAALQNATSSGKPVLLDVNYDNGHF
ncbi:MAG TPA: prolyl oligopeptidase family serine peptidase, partial [Chitinophagaceae bacterium]|nr:prolyl oligopeptidase family serine peptidase [Chitinophagaceae bacterium]